MMPVLDLISPDIPVLTGEDAPGQAISLMERFETDKFPLTTDNHYMGLLQKSVVEETKEEKDIYLLSHIPVWKIKPAIREDLHLLEAFKIFEAYHLKLLPVVNAEEDYLGSIVLEDLLTKFSEFNDFKKEGGLLVLRMKEQDYRLAEIAGLAEAEETTLLGVHTLDLPGTNMLQVYLKTNRKNLHSFIASLQQLHYEIIYSFDQATDTEGMQKNYDHLMNYINM